MARTAARYAPGSPRVKRPGAFRACVVSPCSLSQFRPGFPRNEALEVDDVAGAAVADHLVALLGNRGERNISLKDRFERSGDLFVFLWDHLGDGFNRVLIQSVDRAPGRREYDRADWQVRVRTLAELRCILARHRVPKTLMIKCLEHRTRLDPGEVEQQGIFLVQVHHTQRGAAIELGLDAIEPQLVFRSRLALDLQSGSRLSDTPAADALELCRDLDLHFVLGLSVMFLGVFP